MSTPLTFGQRVRFVATVQRITAVFGEVEDYGPDGDPVGAWQPLTVARRGLGIKRIVGQPWGVEDPWRWPGHPVDGTEPAWKPGTYSMVRRFYLGGHDEPDWWEGIYLSTSWLTEGQRHPGHTEPAVGYFGAWEPAEREPASFSEWRRVPVHYVAVDRDATGEGKPPRGKPDIVTVHVDDLAADASAAERGAA